MSNEEQAAGPPATAPDEGAYTQQLARTITARQAAIMTVAGIIPVGSFFIAAPEVYEAFGTGFVWSGVLAAVICFGIAFCYAELGSMYPVAGGQYSLASRALGPGPGFLTFTTILCLAVIGPTTVGLGIVPYLQEFTSAQLNPHIVGPIVILATGALACISIKGNARLNMVLFFTQVATVLIFIWVGVSNAHQPLSVVIKPVMNGSDGALVPVSFALVMSGVAIAIGNYNGYDGPLELSEEIKDPRRNVPKAIIMSLLIASGMAFIPALMVVIGSPNLHEMMASDNPVKYVIDAATGGNELITDIVVASVIIALLIGNTVAMTNLGRIFFSSGRDAAWPGPVSRWMAKVNARTKTPVVATMSIAVVAAAITAATDILTVLTFAALLLVVVYAMIALSALVSRVQGKDLERPYRMKFWPLPPLVALAGCLLIVIEQVQEAPVNLIITAVILVVGGLYYALYLRPRVDRWVMRDPVDTPEPDAADEITRVAQAGAEGEELS